MAACQDKSSTNLSDWSQGIAGLAEDLKALPKDNKARERFYDGFWNMSVAAACKLMREGGWKGDMHHDAKDVAAQSTWILLRQEARGKGLFSGVARTPEEIRGYLSATIWKGCRQRMGAMARKFMESLDAMLEAGKEIEALNEKCISDPALRMDLMQAISEMREAERGHYRKLPSGMTPIDCVLDLAMGEALVEGIPLRTIQRYMESSRRDLARRINWTPSRRRNKPEEPEM